MGGRGGCKEAMQAPAQVGVVRGCLEVGDGNEGSQKNEEEQSLLLV